MRESESNRASIASGFPAGCLFALMSALVTCVLLFINGAFAMALLRALGKSGADWARKPSVMQFLLLLLPVVLVVLQWMLFDYLRCRFRRPR